MGPGHRPRTGAGSMRASVAMFYQAGSRGTGPRQVEGAQAGM